MLFFVYKETLQMAECSMNDRVKKSELLQKDKMDH